MKFTVTSLTSLLFLAATALASPAPQVTQPPPSQPPPPQTTQAPWTHQARLCNDSNMRGHCNTYGFNLYDCVVLNSQSNNQVSSLDAPWANVHCRFYDSSNCQGSNFLVGSGLWNGLPQAWDNKISSFICVHN